MPPYKVCKTCGKSKDISEFWKHHVNCIPCAKIELKEYRKKNKVRLNAQSRNYRREHPETQKKAYLKFIAKNPDYHMNRYHRYREQHPEMERARKAVVEAIRKGLMTKPDICSVCGRWNKLVAHHHDYSKPLEVVWLCRKCHTKEHLKKNPETYHSIKEKPDPPKPSEDKDGV